ncbi:6-phosphogluconolactonase [Candidatus Saccharibacteria bacterium]|nr:6-phosphogluconolactonase [Candidatus Saccharibacteria bacterium]
MKLVTEQDDQKIVEYLTSTLIANLHADKAVLWLVPGGSAMKVATKVLAELEDVDTSKLCITLTDERYGRPNHPDENWMQLEQLGFNLATINAYRVLRGEDIETTAQDFANKLSQLFATYDYKIGLFGIGADGHTAGIKPRTIAASSDENAAQFEGEDFARVTMTPKAIAQLDEAVAYAHGDDKHLALSQLLHEEIDIYDQPAQALKTVPKVTLFSDFAD